MCGGSECVRVWGSAWGGVGAGGKVWGSAWKGWVPGEWGGMGNCLGWRTGGLGVCDG